MKNFSLSSNDWIAFPINEENGCFEERYSDEQVIPKVSYRCTIPGTVLRVLIENGVYPDPYIGMNSKAIPDIGEVGPRFYTWWFRRTFTLGWDIVPGQRVWLYLRGVNYKAKIFLNQRFVGSTEGMFLRSCWDLTDHLATGCFQSGSLQKNSLKDSVQCLAILVEPPPHHGTVPPLGGQGGDHEIGKDVTAQFTAGWDWVIPIPDRNTGIWDKIEIKVTGPVRLQHAWVRAQFPQDCWNSDNIGAAQADFCIPIKAYIEVFNASSEDVCGTLKFDLNEPNDASELDGSFEMVGCMKEMEVEVKAQTVIQCQFDDIKLNRAFLWWPNGLGKQPLYDCTFSFCPKTIGDHSQSSDEASDEVSVNLGVRDLKSWVDPSTGGRIFQVNGHEVFVRGGNWITSDAMLRLSGERYCQELGLWHQMGLNMIRVWGGGITERPEFFGWCDVYGLLVWQDFWVTGDNFGRGAGDSQYPLDRSLFLRCAEDAILMLRSHASLAMWCGGNEQRPCAELNEPLKNLVETLDPGRLYVCGSVWDGFADGEGGNGYDALHDGPYTVQNPTTFFEEDFYRYGFNPEIGSIGVPSANTMKKFLRLGESAIPEFSRMPLAEDVIYEKAPLLWDHHKYIGYGDPEKGVYNQLCLYGVPTTLEEFCEQAQMANFEQYRALVESWGSQMWSKYTGMLIWKVQNPWPGLRGQLYDWFLQKTGGFYGCMVGLEPVHIQLNMHTFCIEVINTTPTAVKGLIVKATTMDTSGKFSKYYSQDGIEVPSKGKWCSVELRLSTDVLFLVLDLFDSDLAEHTRDSFPFVKWRLDEQGQKKVMLKTEKYFGKHSLEYSKKQPTESCEQTISMNLRSRNVYWKPQEWQVSKEQHRAPDYSLVRSWSKSQKVQLDVNACIEEGVDGFWALKVEVTNAGSSIALGICVEIDCDAPFTHDLNERFYDIVKQFSLLPKEVACIKTQMVDLKEISQGQSPYCYQQCNNPEHSDIDDEENVGRPLPFIFNLRISGTNLIQHQTSIDCYSL